MNYIKTELAYKLEREALVVFELQNVKRLGLEAFGQTYKGSKNNQRLNAFLNPLNAKLSNHYAIEAEEIKANQEKFYQTSIGHQEKFTEGALLAYNEATGIKLIITTDGCEPYYILDHANRYNRVHYSDNPWEQFEKAIASFNTDMTLGERRTALAI